MCFISSKTISVKVNNSFTSSFRKYQFVSRAVFIFSSFNFLNKLINHLACMRGSHPDIVHPHFFQKYGIEFFIIFNISIFPISLAHSKGIVSGLWQ
jgi:hypothetical protein